MLVSLFSAIALLLSIGTATFAPYLTSRASADTVSTVGGAETAVDLPDRKGGFTTCQAQFGNEPMSVGLLNRALGSVGAYPAVKQPSDLDALAHSNPTFLSSGIVDQLKNLLAAGTSVPTINFVPYSKSNNPNPINGILDTSVPSICSSYTMIPEGFSTLTNQGAGEGTWFMVSATIGSNVFKAMTWSFPVTLFTPNDVNGTLTYDFSAVGDCTNSCTSRNGSANQGINKGITKVQGSDPFTIKGPINTSQPVGSGGTSNGAVVVNWLNASQFVIASTSDPNAASGEVYTKQSWGGTANNGKAFYSYYFLTNTGPSETTSRTLYGSSLGCADPMPNGAAPWTVSCSSGNNVANHSGSNCVPFFVMNVDLDEPDSATNHGSAASDFQRLQSNINYLGNPAAGGGSYPMTYYNYTPTSDGSGCSYDGSTTNITRVNTPNGTPQVWFLYSPADKEFITVFTSGGTNESNYIGLYNQSAPNIFQGPNGGCVGQITLPSGVSLPTQTGVGPGLPSTIFKVNWRLGYGSCPATVLGTLQVQAMAVNEDTFNSVQNNLLNSGSTGSTAPPKLACDFFTLNPLNWIFCPLISTAEEGAGKLDDLINHLLTISADPSNPNSIFSDSSSGSQTSNPYHVAWAAFRVVALGMIAIASLIMVIAQAAGLDFLDAYTIRKILPRLLIAAVAITLSWSIWQFLTQLSNAAGVGVRDMVYAPFSGLKQANLAGGSSIVLLLLGTGAAVAFGMLALFSFAVTGLLAGAVGAVVLIGRVEIYTLAVMISSFGIALSILPQTQKGWKIYYDTSLGLLVSFPIISFMIASGRVIAATAMAQSASGSNQTILQMIAIVSYFAPYFLIPFAFRLAGGLLATVGGFANDRSRGAFDRLKKFRAGEVKKNVAALGSGERFRNGAIGSRLNDFTSGAAAFANSDDKLGFLTNSRSRGSALAFQRETGAHRFGESARGKFLQHNDAANQVATYKNEAEARARARDDFGLSDHELEEAIADVRSTGGWSRSRAIQATGRLFATGTGFKRGIGQAMKTVARVSGGNGGIAASLVGAGRQASTGAGRVFMGSSGFGTQVSLANEYAELEQARARGEDVRGREAAVRMSEARANLEAFTSTDASTLLRAKPEDLKNGLSLLPNAIAELQAQATDRSLGHDVNEKAQNTLGKVLGGLDTLSAFKMYGAPVNAGTVYDATHGTGMSDGTPVAAPNDQQAALSAQMNEIRASLVAAGVTPIAPPTTPVNPIAQGYNATLGAPPTQTGSGLTGDPSSR